MLLVGWLPATKYYWFFKLLLIVDFLKMSADSALKTFILHMHEELVLQHFYCYLFCPVVI